jgi:hypothetical protein
MNKVEAELKAAGVCGSLYHKDILAPPDALAGRFPTGCSGSEWLWLLLPATGLAAWLMHVFTGANFVHLHSAASSAEAISSNHHLWVGCCRPALRATGAHRFACPCQGKDVCWKLLEHLLNIHPGFQSVPWGAKDNLLLNHY